VLHHCSCRRAGRGVQTALLYLTPLFSSLGYQRELHVGWYPRSRAAPLSAVAGSGRVVEMEWLARGRGSSSVGAKVETLRCLDEREACGGVSGDVMGVARDVVVMSEVPLYRASE
jgi:hypothetical protein